LYSGIPAAGSTIANNAGDHTFTLAADYTANNAMYLNPSNAITLGTNTNVVVTLLVPTALSGMSFLNSSGNGPRNINVFIHHQDGTTENKVFSSPDWFGVPGANLMWSANGRVEVDTSRLNSVPRPLTTTNNTPQLGFSDVIVDNFASAITNIVLVDTNTGGRTAIFAISGTTGPIPPSFATQPNSITTTQTANVTLTATAIANDTITYSWQKGTNGVFVTLSDGGITFQHVRDDGSANSLHVGDIELLGHVVPVLTINAGGGGTLTIVSSISGELFSKTNLVSGADVWHDEGPITGGSPVTITPQPGDTAKFYRVLAQ
jgi:hypothetical protein